MSSKFIQTRTHRITSTDVLTVTAGLHHFDQQDSHFSLLGDITRQLPGGRMRMIESGIIFNQILQYFPDLQPLAEIHLSNRDGVPLHALENGWYWAGGSEWNGSKPNDPPNAKYLESHLRIFSEDANAIVEAVASGSMNKEDFAAIVEALKPSWLAQADRVSVFLSSGEWPEASPEIEAPSLAQFLPSATSSGPRP